MPTKSKLGREILSKACEDSSKYVFFFANPGQKYEFSDEYQCDLDFDSDLEFLPCLLTRKKVEATIRGQRSNSVIVDEVVGDGLLVDFPLEITEPIQIITDEKDSFVGTVSKAF